MSSVSLKTVRESLPVERQAKIAARTAELIAEEMTLRDLRKARDLTQERLAELLSIGQDSVSRLEKRSDLLLSTLRSYVEAMGGSLELVATFPDRPPVTIKALDILRDEVERPVRAGERASKSTEPVA